MDTMTDRIQTMPNKTNRSLIVGSQKLFQANNILTEFAIGHDVYLFSYDETLSLTANTKALFRDLLVYLRESYDHIVFMGYGVDCNILYGMCLDKNLYFDASVFVNYEEPYQMVPHRVHNLLAMKESKIYSFSTKGNEKRPVEYTTDHQYVKSLFGNIRSKRLAKEIFGCVVYGAYKQNYLSGQPTVFVQ